MTQGAGRAVLSRASLFLYAALAFPLAFAGLPLYIHAPDFYATHHGVPLAALGVVLLALRFTDALQDPLIGYASMRWVRHRRFILVAALMLMAGGFVALFHPAHDHALGWFAGAMLMATTGFSILTINLNALGSGWSHDAHQKTRIATWRESVGLLGLMLAVLIPSLLQKYVSADGAFHLFSLILLGVLVPGALLFMAWYSRHAPPAGDENGKPEGLFSVFLHFPKRLRTFFIIYGLSIFASSIPAVLVLFFIRDRLGAEASAGLFLMLYFLAGALFMPVWLYASRRWGKRMAWQAAMLLAVISFIWAFFLTHGSTLAYGIICVLSGMAFGAELSLPPAILSTLLQEENQHERTTVYFAVLTFFSKAGLALAAAISFPVLDALGFKAGAANSPSALLGLSVCYALLPCAIKIVAITILMRAKKSPGVARADQSGL